MQTIGSLIARWHGALFDFEPQSSRHTARWMLAVAAAAVVLAAVLRLALAGYSLTFDEFASLHFARFPVATLWGPQAVIETNPPLFYSLLALWKGLGAQSVVALRALPILLGTGSIALTGLIAARWFSPRAGLIAVVLMGISAPHIFYSNLLRGYILSLDGVLLSIAGLLLIVHQHGRRDTMIGWGLHVAGSALAIYSHTTMFLWPVVAAAATLGLYGRQLFAGRARLLTGLIAANLAILAIAAWWLWITWLQLRGGAETIAWLKPIGPREYLRQLLATSMLSFDHYDRDKLASAWIALLTSAAAFALWRDRTGRFLVLLALASVVIFGVAGAVKPILMPRTIFWMSIFPVLLMAGGLGALRIAWARWALLAVCAALLVANLVRQAPRFEQQDWQRKVAVIARDPQALLLVHGQGVFVSVREACLLELGQPCPFPVIVLPYDPRAPSRPTWAAGTVRETPLAGLRQNIPADRKVYVLSARGAEPLKELGLTSGPLTGAGLEPFLAGPLAAGVVLAGRPET